MKKIIFSTLAVFALSAAAATAQDAAPARTTTTPPAVANPSDTNRTTAAPVAGRNSFTEDQARKRFMDNGYTKEEMKIVWETRKILGDDAILVNPTAVRVPVFFGHSEAVHLETTRKLTAEQARALLEAAPGVEVVDDREAGGYPTPVTHAAGTDAVYVGRIREDLSHPRGLDLWIVSDNIRKGAALNAVQIAELVVTGRS